MVLIPVYEDPEDAKCSPFKLANAEPFTWQWLSTINRVNSQVQKVRLGCSLSWELSVKLCVQDTRTFVREHTCVFAGLLHRICFPGMLGAIFYPRDNCSEVCACENA
jgi:hypothetical protein